MVPIGASRQAAPDRHGQIRQHHADRPLFAKNILALTNFRPAKCSGWPCHCRSTPHRISTILPRVASGVQGPTKSANFCRSDKAWLRRLEIGQNCKKKLLQCKKKHGIMKTQNRPLSSKNLHKIFIIARMRNPSTPPEPACKHLSKDTCQFTPAAILNVKLLRYCPAGHKYIQVLPSMDGGGNQRHHRRRKCCHVFRARLQTVLDSLDCLAKIPLLAWLPNLGLG